MEVVLIEDLAQQKLPARTAAAVLRRAGQSAGLVHFGGTRDTAGVVAAVRASRPRVVVASILFAHCVPETLDLMAALRAEGVAAHLTMMGALPTFAYRELLAACPALDSVLRGEAETGIAKLAQLADEPDAWGTVPGLAYRRPQVTANPVVQPAASLDDLPFPLRGEAVGDTRGAWFATVEGSRGCYHSCTFCLGRLFHRPYRLRSAASLADEIEELCQVGVRLFLFDDEQFLPPGDARRERVTELGQELERRQLRIAFTIKCRPDDVEEGLFRDLRRIGLVRAYVGIESGCQATLDLLGKGTTPAVNLRALRVLHRLDLVADFRDLVFHPWSTLEMLHEETGFLERVLPYLVTCFDFREVEVFPGTTLARRLSEEGRGVGDPWPMHYSIADPRVELMRRLSRLVFDATGAYGRARDLITQNWFDLLLRRRLGTHGTGPAKEQALRDLAGRLNAHALVVWREMLAFVAEGDVRNAEQVNELASAWARRLQTEWLAAREQWGLI